MAKAKIALLYERLSRDDELSGETFDNVQRIRGNVKRYPDGWGEAAPLIGQRSSVKCRRPRPASRTATSKRKSGG